MAKSHILTIEYGETLEPVGITQNSRKAWPKTSTSRTLTATTAAATAPPPEFPLQKTQRPCC